MKNKTVKKSDIYIFIAAVLVVAVTAFAFLKCQKPGKTVVVSVENKVVYTAPLTKDETKTIETPLGKNIIEVKNKKCSCTFSNCRDEICIAKGKIDKKGQSIVCLPHKMIVEIK